MAFLILLIIVVVLAPIVLAIMAFVRTGRHDQEIRDLKNRIELLTHQVEADLVSRSPEPSAPGEAPPEAMTDAPQDVVMDAEFVDEGIAESAEPPEEEQEEPDEPETVPPIAANVAHEPQRPRQGFEQKLTVQWMVWLGGVAIALSGVFLVKYAADAGYFGPAARCAMAFLLGIALVTGAEWLRRNPKHGLARFAPGSYVPQALTAAGLFTAFASVYAAYGLFNLLAPLVAFAALALIAVCGFGLALLQGPFVALLGLVGGLVTPLLVSTDTPSALGLFSYVTVIIASCLAVVRYMRWWWLAFGAIAGGGAWALLWFAAQHTPGDVLVMGAFLLALAAMSLFFWWGYEIKERPANWLADMRGVTMPELAGWTGAIIVAFLMPGLVQFSDQSFASLVFVAILCGLYGWFARRVPAFDGLLVLAGLVVLFVISAWQLPGVREAYGEFPLPGGWRFLGPILDDDLVPFATTAAVFGAMFAAGGFFGLWQAKRPTVWAGVSGAVPIGLLVLSYLRINERVPDLNWSILALILAGIAVTAARMLNARRDDPRLLPALGVYAAVAVSALSFAATMMFDRALLTVALSLQLPALAWIAHVTGVKLLRWIAAALAGVVLARLALNWNVLDYPLGRSIASNWIIYGYGIPAAAFYWAARQFKQLRDDHVVTLLEGGALLFATLLVSLEIRVLVEGSLGAGRYGLFEQSLQTVSWLVIALSRMWSHAARPRFTNLWGARILMCLALAQIVFLQLLASNPVFTGDPVGRLPVFNDLFLAYALPGALLLATTWWLGRIGFGGLTKPVQFLSFILFFVFVSMEVQHAYQGQVLTGVAQSDAEFYSYSVAWLGFALVLLALGIYRQAPMLRYASLAVLLLTVAKVFLLDMADLTGLLRVASFLGLGLCLVGIGYIYQRFVFPLSDDQEVGENPESTRTES